MKRILLAITVAMVIILGTVIPAVAAPPATTTTSTSGWTALDLNNDGTTDYLYQATVVTDKWGKVILIDVDYTTPDGVYAGEEYFKTASHPKNAGCIAVDLFPAWTYPLFDEVTP